MMTMTAAASRGGEEKQLIENYIYPNRLRCANGKDTNNQFLTYIEKTELLLQ